MPEATPPTDAAAASARSAPAAAVAALPELDAAEPSDAVETGAPVEAVASLPVARIQLPELKGAAAIAARGQFGLLLDVGVEVAAVVGVREIKLENVLAIHPGAIIDLDKHAGEPIELYVNGKPIALAEIVVVDGRLGARVVQSLATPDAR